MDINSLMQVLEPLLIQEPDGSESPLPSIAWASTRGLVRSENQDRVMVARLPRGLVFAGVADGIAGLREGSRAATLALASAVSYCTTSSKSNLHELLVDALNFANQTVYREVRGSGGATLVVALLTSKVCFIGHAGDSRAYSVTRDSRLTRLTRDDTLAEHVDRGDTDTGDQPSGDRRLLQCVGMGADFQPHVSRSPGSGHGLLLTTDGIHTLPHTVMEWVIERASNVSSVAERLIRASEWHGGSDNATLISIDISRPLDVSDIVSEDDVAATEIWVPGTKVDIPAVKPATVDTDRQRLIEERSLEQARRVSKSSNKKHAARPKRDQNKGGPQLVFEFLSTGEHTGRDETKM